MCFQYKCADCKEIKLGACAHYDNNAKRCPLFGEKLPRATRRSKCYTCVTIKGVIVELRNLLYREPWLGTEGLSGAPRKESWETDNNNNNNNSSSRENEEYDSGGEDPDGYTREQRKKVRREAERAVALRWGLMKAEQSEERE
ncbi:uncharacterized protein A1O9_06129, partial [Exophiala aquamarina CBS 119918]